MKRYDPIEYYANGGGWGWAPDSTMRECPDGEWVRITEVERENAALRQALKQARAWGVTPEGFSAEQSRKLAVWIDAGMVGKPPSLPNYYPPTNALANCVSAEDSK